MLYLCVVKIKGMCTEINGPPYARSTDPGFCVGEILVEFLEFSGWMPRNEHIRWNTRNLHVPQLS